MEPIVARQTWRTLEPLHGMIYFTPLADACYRQVGLAGNREQYFGSRAAALGPVPAEVVIATFYNFFPGLVRRCIPAAWAMAEPSAILAARLEAADRTLVDSLGADVGSAEMAEAAALARRAAERAVELGGAGRPLFAGHASLAWPDEPHLALFHAQTLLREYRGDGHIAALVLAGLDPVETLITHGGTGEVAMRVLKETRDWPDGEWAAGAQRLVARGLLESDGERLSADGVALRQRIEDETDRAALAPYESLGEDGCARLRALARPFSKTLVASGLMAMGRTDRGGDASPST
jgi:hypothetical protein